MSNIAKTCAFLCAAGAVLLCAPQVSAQPATLQGPAGVKAFFLPYPKFNVPIVFTGRDVSLTNATGAYVLLVWNDPSVESDSTVWKGYRIRRYIPGITTRPLSLHCPNPDSCAGEVVGQLKARDRVTSLCLAAYRPCDTQFNLFGIGGGFFFNGFRNNVRSDGSHFIDVRAKWRDMPGASNQELRAIWGASGADAFSVGTGGTILRFDGISWSLMSSPGTTNLNAISGSSGTRAFAVGDSVTVLAYDGNVWTRTAVPAISRPLALRGIWTSAPNNGFAVGDSGITLSYNGSSWDSLPSGTTAHLRGVWGTSPSDGFAVGDGGTILHFDGAAWQPMASGTTRNLHAVWGLSSSAVFASGDDGAILRFDGVAWSADTSGTHRTLRSLWGTSSSDLFAAGAGGEILHYDGTTPGKWASMTSVSPSFLRGIWGSAGTNVFAVGSGGTIVRYDGTNPIVDACARCRVFLDVGNLSGFKSRYAVTSIDTTSTQYEVRPAQESDITQLIEVTPSSPPASNLERVGVVPNPYKGAAEWDLPGQRGIHFIHLPDGASVRIFTSNLDLVRELKMNAGANPGGPTGELEWDMRNGNGREVTSGIYLYRVDTPQGLSRNGHFVIIK